MKFVVQLVATFLAAAVKSGKKLFSLSKLNFVDTCVFCSTVFLAAGYYYPWCLIVAFVCMLPPLQEQLYLPEDGGATGNEHKMTLEEELQSKIMFEEKELAREMTGGEVSSQEPTTEETAVASATVSSPDSTKERRKKEKKDRKDRKSASDKPRVGKSLWGLPTLRVRDSSGRIIEINSDKPVPVETDYFKGTILMMLRTDGDLEEYNRYEHHFNGKQRKFEVQFQGNMKNVPQGEVMLGGELQEKMDISFVTRALLSVITKFCMSLNPFLHFGFGETAREDGMYELPHLTFPLFRVMDRVIVTPPGGELPELGKELKEDEQQRKDRRAGRGDVLSFKQGYTYSFSFHSMYTDFSRWAICNFPGYKAIDIRGFFGQQHVNVVCYEISEKDMMASGKPLHYNAHKRYLLTLELKHVLCMSPEELEEAEQDDAEQEDDSVSEEGSESNDEVDNSDEASTTDMEQPHFDGDEMDEESLAIAREMADDQRDFDDLDTSEVVAELLHMPDESELIPGDSVVSLIAIPAPWEPWDQELALDSEPVDTASKDFDLDINPSDGLSALRPAMDRSGGSRIMHGNAITHEDAGLSPKRTCFGVADVGGVAIRKECSNLPAVRFIPVTPPHISTSRLARLSLRRNNNTPTNPSPAPARRKGMLSALYPRRRNKSHAEKHSTITPDTTAATDKVSSHNGLRCGDAVQIQSATTNRFLTVHKGWWLGWSMEEYVATSSAKHNRIASKVLFTIHPTDSTGLKYMPHGTPLVAGMPFRLRSVRWPDWEVGCCEPGRQDGDRQSPVVLYYAKIKVRNFVPTSGPVKWHNSSKKVNPLCLSVMHEENVGGVDGRRRSMSSGSGDMMMSPPHGSTGFESNVGPLSGPKRLFGVSPTRIIHMSSDITGISGAKEESSSVATGSILTQFLAPLDTGSVLSQNDLDLNVTVSGWVEVLNRSLNYTQLAYIITVCYKSNTGSEKATKWTTLRTQEDLEEIFSQIEDKQSRDEELEKCNEETKDSQTVRQTEGKASGNSEGESSYRSNEGRRYGGNVAGADNDQWSIVDRDDEDRIESGSERLSSRRSVGPTGSDKDGDAPITPSRPQSTRSGVLRRSRVNIQRHDIAPNHLCPADQNVLIMTNRIAKALNAVKSDPGSRINAAFNSTDSLLSYDDNQKPKDVVHTSRDDGSGTQGHGDDVPKQGGAALEHDRVAALKGYLSDSTIPHTPRAESPIVCESESPPLTSVCVAKKAFLSALSAPQILDTWFLSEDSDKYLRAPPPSKKSPPRMQVAIVARALWDSHWREEIAIVHPSYIAFYPLLAKKASWTLYLQELIGISHVADATSPLPGFSILRIETIGRLHYLAFSSKESCNVMAASVLEHFSEITFDSSMPLAGEMGDPRDRFVLKSGRWRPTGRRLVLNARKFLFDVEEKSNNSTIACATSGDPISDGAYIDGSAAKLDFSEHGVEPYWKFAERLLQDVFRLELNSTSDADGLFPGREMIIKFLDETVKLKQINLQKDIKFSSPEALCFFTNIYHTLLMHARLVLGPPSQQDWASFFDTVCYEIGSDVFSLCEIEHCVLGGRLARPRSVPRYFAPMPRSNDDHYLYALPAADRRMRFLVNYGSISLLPTVYLMTPETMHNSLNEASIAFFESSMVVEMKKRTVTLPKICDVFGQDFGEDPLAVLRHILRYLNRDNWEKVSILLTNSKTPTVKFQDLKARSHTRLHLVIQK